MIAQRIKHKKNLQSMLLKNYSIRPLQVIMMLPVNIKVNSIHKSIENSFWKNALIPSYSMDKAFDKHSRRTFSSNYWIHYHWLHNWLHNWIHHWIYQSCLLIPMIQSILHTARQISSETWFQVILLLSIDGAIYVIIIFLQRNTFELNALAVLINLDVNTFDY